jgi:hypothetical protein
MHAFEHVVGLKAARLLRPVAKPFRRKHDDITDLRLRRLTQMTERVLRLVRHIGNRGVIGQAKVLRRKRTRSRDAGVFSGITCTITPFSRASHGLLTRSLAQPDVLSRARNSRLRARQMRADGLRSCSESWCFGLRPRTATAGARKKAGACAGLFKILRSLPLILPAAARAARLPAQPARSPPASHARRESACRASSQLRGSSP